MDFGKVVWALSAVALIECAVHLPVVSAQTAQLHAGQEVRAYNDSLHTMISGRVFRVSAKALELIRSPDAPPTTLQWTDIHRLEVKAPGGWVPIVLVRDSALLGDSTGAAGALAGAAAGRRSKQASYFWPAVLASSPLGYFGPFALCSDCDAYPKVIAASGVVAVVVISGRARAKAQQFPRSLEAEIEEKPPAYQAAYREAYSAAFSNKLQKQVMGGSLVGLAAGFGALVYAFVSYDWN